MSMSACTPDVREVTTLLCPAAPFVLDPSLDCLAFLLPTSVLVRPPRSAPDESVRQQAGLNTIIAFRHLFPHS